MANTIYITAGLPVAKNADQDPTGTNTVYITAGLPPIELEDTPIAEPIQFLAVSSQNYALAFTK